MTHHHDWPDHEVETLSVLCEMSKSEVDQAIDERWLKLTANLVAAEGCASECRKLTEKIDAFSSRPPDEAAASTDPAGLTYLGAAGEADGLALLRELQHEQYNRTCWHTHEAREAYNTLANYLLADGGKMADLPGARASLDHFAARLAQLPA